MKSVLTALLILISFSFLSAQNNVVIDSSLWQPNGKVNKLKVMGDTLVIAGDFNMVGPNTPYASGFDNNGDLIANFPHTNGEVTKAIADDKNGFYIAGDFTKVDGKQRGGIAYIDSNNKVTSFFENRAVDGNVYDMELKDSLLYIVGEFTGTNNYTGGGAVIKVDTALVDFSFPTIEGDVYASEADGEGGVYIGGLFTKVGEYERANIAHIDKYGRVTPWNPGTDGEVRAIAIDERHVYIGGIFNYAGCVERNKLAVFEKGKSTPNTWKYSSLDFNGAGIFSLLVYGGKLYAGSGNYFGGIGSGGSGPAGIYFISRSSGKILTYATNMADVHALEAGPGYIFAGGDKFTANFNEQRVVRVDTNSGSLTRIIFPEIEGTVYGLKYHNNVLYIGGYHTNYTDILAYNFSTNSRYSFKSQIPGVVYDMEVFNDSILTVCGFFKSDVDYQNNIVAYNTNSLEKYNFPYQSASPVLTISKLNANTLFLGGHFSTLTIGNYQNVAAININTSKQKNWGYNFDKKISAIQIKDTSIYVGGEFTRVNRSLRLGLAKLNPNDTALPAWNATLNRFVNDLELKGDTLFIAGDFTKIGAANISNLGAININTAIAHPWDAKVKGSVLGIKLHNSTLFVNGSFVKVDTFSRQTLAALDAHTAAVLPFKGATLKPGVSSVEKISVWKNNLVCAGNITDYFDNPRRYIAIYDINTGAEVHQSINTSFYLSAIAATKNNTLFIGGKFKISGGEVRRSIALINLSTGKLYPWHADIDEEVFDFDIADGKIYYVGLFKNVKGTARNSIAASYLSNGALHTWNPILDKYSGLIHISNGKAFIGNGPFTTINGISRKYLAAIDTGTAQATSFQPFKNATSYTVIYSLHSYKNSLYVGGSFTSIDTKKRNFIASFDATTDALLNFDAKLSGNNLGVRVEEIFNSNSTLYFGGTFTKTDSIQANGFLRADADSTKTDTSWFPHSNDYAMPMAQNNSEVFFKLNKSELNNRCRCFVSAIDTGTKKMSPWYPQIELKPTAIGFANDKVYLGGEFTTFNNQERDYLTGARLEAIEISPLESDSFCRGGTMVVKANASGNFTTSNEFILQLSDSMGSFAAPIFYDTITSTNDSFVYQIPLNLTPGNNYRLKLYSTMPALVSREEISITILPDPKASFSVNDTYQCPYENFTFTNTSNIPGAVTWKYGDGDTGNLQTQTHSYSNSGNYNVRMVLKPYGVGCPLDSTEIPVVALPIPQPSFALNDSVLCNHNDTFNFTNTSIISGGSIVAYTWNFGNGTTSTDTNTTVSYIDTGKYTVTLIAISDSACVDSIRNNIFVIEKPQAHFSTNSIAQCFTGNNYVFTDSSIISPYATNITYAWSFGDLATSAQQNPTHTYSDTGYYIITLQVNLANNCFDTTRSIAIVVPEPKIDTIFGPTIVTKQDTSRYSILTDTFTTYFWSVDYGTISLGADSSYADIIWDSVVAATNTTLKIFPINIAGCYGDTAYLNITISPFHVGVVNIINNKLKIYPNPTKKSVFIDINNKEIITGQVQLFDVQGREVFNQTFDSISMQVLEIDVSKIGAGTYQLLFSSGKYISADKLIILQD